MSGNGGEKLGWKCLLVVLMVFGLNVEPSWSSCSAPFPIKNGTLQIITKPNPGSGKYPENAEAKVECDPGFRLTYAEYEYVICTNGAWKHHVKPEESICAPIHCGRPPVIEHGHYTSETTRFKLGDRAGQSYPYGTVLVPTCELQYSINCTHNCGRIHCGTDGSWIPKDERLITKCVAGPLLNKLSPVADNRGTGSETGLKHYLIITLAVICILIVGALLVLLLRRPTFCKKQGRSRTSSGAGGGNFNPNLLRGCDDNSVSPIPAPLDSLPVAMNTGIFVPGGSYDWQECRFQESTLTGTSVFK